MVFVKFAHRMFSIWIILFFRSSFSSPKFDANLSEGSTGNIRILAMDGNSNGEQGGGLNNYEISYWVKGQPRAINKTDLRIGRPTADADGFISYEIKNLQIGVEYLVAVYGENQYSTDVLDRSYYSSEIFATPSVGRM